MRALCLAALLLAALIRPAVAEVPHQIPAQGRLSTSAGLPVDSGTYQFTFRIMNDSTGGVEVWPGTGGETQTLYITGEGLWQARIGAVKPLPETLFDDTLLWLEIAVDDGSTSEVLSRMRLGTGPWAFQAAFATRSGEAASLGGLLPGDVALSEHAHTPSDIVPQGAGSGLDADLLDGQQAADFAAVVHGHNPAAISPQGSGSGLDADLVDGHDATEFAAAVHEHTPLAISPQGSGSGLDADLLDGHDASEFADTLHTHAGLWSINGPNYFFNGGRVGIGTTSPENMLHVQSGAGANVIPNSASVGILEADNHAYLSLITPDFAERGILFAEPSSSMAGSIIYNNTLTPDGLQFRTAFNVTGMALESSGRLAIGTMNGGGVLQVVGLANNSSVALPTNSIGPDEILAEAGIATNFNGATPTLTSTTMQDVVTVQVDVPASGYVVLSGKCNGLTHGVLGRNQGTVQIDETTGGSPVSPYSATFGLVGYTDATLANSFPVYVQRVYFKSAGSYTFRLEAAQNAGNAVGAITRVSQSILTATFYPTSYGDAMTVVPASEAADFSSAKALSADEGEGFRVDLRELELRAARLRIESQAADLALERARGAANIPMPKAP
jgi:hypothetical protein